MQMPSWARRQPGQKPAAPAPKAAPKSAVPAGPTIRDDEWWKVRMKAWDEAYPNSNMPRGKLAFWLALDVDQKPNDGAPTTPTNLDFILDRYVEGENMKQLADYMTELLGFRVSAAQLRTTITTTAVGAEKYASARRHISHRLVEEALEHADSAKAHGDFRVAIDTKTKLASKLNPEEYGDKSQINLGGVAGSPIESRITQTPAEAYKAMLG